MTNYDLESNHSDMFLNLLRDLDMRPARPRSAAESDDPNNENLL